MTWLVILSLTEVVFELGDARHPLARLTAEDGRCRAVYRFAETDVGASGVSALTLLCGGEAAAALARDLQETGHYADVSLVSLSPYAAVFRLRRAAAPATTAPAPLERMLEVFGPEAIFEPLFVERGKVRVRVILAEPMETRRVLGTIGGLQRAMGWEDFRTLRVGEFKATQYALSMRRLLDAEQESVLRLAVRLGYYESPKRCTLQDIARALGFSVSPVHKRLKAIEQVLVGAVVQPGTAKVIDPRSRPRQPSEEPTAPGDMTEVHLRVAWPALPFSALTRRSPGTQVVLQPLGEDAVQGFARTFAVVLAPEKEQPDALHEIEKHASVTACEKVSRDAEHVSLKLRWRTDDGAVFPTASLLRRLGRDVHARPVVVDGGDVFIRAVLTHPSSLADLRARLETMAREARWTEFEVVDHRRIDSDPALTGPSGERMTARQVEILKIAHALGYYRTPRGCTLDDVARTLGISANAIHKNLTAAEEKIVSSYLTGALPP